MKRPKTERKAKRIYEILQRNRALVRTLSAIVVFATTYLLVLPAFTLEQDTAAELGGIDVPAAELTTAEEETAVPENAEAVETAEAEQEPSATEESVPAQQETTPVESDGEAVEPAAAEAETEPVQTTNTLEFKSEGATVSAAYSEGAGLPEGTELTVNTIDEKSDEYDRYYQDALEAVQKESAEQNGQNQVEKLAFARFYDISLQAGGTEVQPDAPVTVTIAYDKTLPAADRERVKVLHFTREEETGKAVVKVLDPKQVHLTVDQGEMSKTSFETESFSVYAVVYAEDPEIPESGNVFRYTADDGSYTITVTCEEGAEIPAGAELAVREIEPGSDEYIQHIGRLWSEINQEYFENEEKREHYDETMGILPDLHLTNINMARFFDVTFLYNGTEIEPQIPVSVEISYEQGLYAPEGTTPGVVHFVSEDEIDIVENVDTTVAEDEATSFRYEQDSFSVVGTYVGQETRDLVAEPNLTSSLDPEGKGTGGTVDLSENAIEDIILSAPKPAKGLRAESAEQPSDNDHSELEHPVGSKTLVPNKDESGQKDGTYTLSLSVKGHSSSSSDTEVKKSNILFVMDRSSSMITNTVDNNEGFRY
ncbi:MAG: hypothetical protein IJH77_02945, partial [Mogibacterium sp.]|nr:hypothetical protein [Mogibacterium sp.]